MIVLDSVPGPSLGDRAIRSNSYTPKSIPLTALAGAGIDGEIAQMSCLRRYRAGETIIDEGEPAEFVGTVVSGVLKVSRRLPDDRQQIVELLFAGDFFGRPYVPSSNFSLEAATETVLRCVKRRAFETLLERHVDLQQRLLVSALDELEAARERMVQLGCRDTLERVAGFFLLLFKQVSRQPATALRPDLCNTVTFPIGRRDIAGYLGTTVETLSRHVQLLSRQGIIKILDANRYEIVDYCRLVSYAGQAA